MKNIIKIIIEKTKISNRLQTIKDKKSVYEFFKYLKSKTTLKEFGEGLKKIFSNNLKEKLRNEELLNISGGKIKPKILSKTTAGILAALLVGSTAFPHKVNAYKEFKPYNSIKSIFSNKKYLIGAGVAILAAIGIPTAMAVKYWAQNKCNPMQEENNDTNTQDYSAPECISKSIHDKNHCSVTSPTEKLLEFTGIKNDGSTCYFNSALQILFQIPEIRNNNLTNLSSDKVLKIQLNGIKTSVYELQKQKEYAEKTKNTFINEFLLRISKENELIQAVKKLDLQYCKNKIQELESIRKDLYNNKKYSESIRISCELDVYKAIECLIQLFSMNHVLKNNEKIDRVCSLFNIIDRDEEKLSSVLNILFRKNKAAKNTISKLFKDAYPQYENLKNKYSDIIVKLAEINGNKSIIETEEEKEQNRKNLENLNKIMTKLNNKEAPNDIMKNILIEHNICGQEDVSRVIESYFTGIPRELVSIKNLEIVNPEIDKNLLKEIPSKYKLIGINRYEKCNKVIQNIDVPETIEDVYGQKYELASVAIYISSNGLFGHYYAYSKNDNGDWYKLDDSSVTCEESYENIKNDIYKNSRLALYRPVSK